MILLLSTSGIVLAQTGRSTSTQRPDFAEARRLIVEGMAKDSVPGAAIAVVRDGEIVWEEGFGWADRMRAMPATPQTPFALASLTKTFIATAAMVMQQQHRVRIDAPANDYLGDAKLWSPAWNVSGATLERLLRHTAGLTTFDLACKRSEPSCRMPNTDEIIRRYGVVVWPPGEEFDYSNLGYFVVGEALSRAAGKPLDRLLQSEVFDPLGMHSTSMGRDLSRAAVSATAYPWVEDPMRREELRDTAGYSSEFAYASAHDLALFGAFQLGAHRPDQRAILSDSAREAMAREAVAANGVGTGYGLGWWTEANRFGVRSLLAQGGNDRTNAWLRLIPSARIAVAFVVNRGVGFPEGVVDAAIGGILPEYWDKRMAQVSQSSSSAPKPPSAPSLDASVTGKWVGNIRLADAEMPIQLTIAADGSVQLVVDNRAATGIARASGTRLFIVVSSDLEGPSTATDKRELRLYLEGRGDGFNGTVTTVPPRASGLTGRVSYWLQIARP